MRKGNGLLLKSSVKTSVIFIICVALVVSCGVFISPVSAATDWRDGAQPYTVGETKNISFPTDTAIIKKPNDVSVRGVLYKVNVSKDKGYRMDYIHNIRSPYDYLVFDSKGKEIDSERVHDNSVDTLTNGFIFPRDGTYYIFIIAPSYNAPTEVMTFKMEETSILKGTVTDYSGKPLRLINIIGIDANQQGVPLFGVYTNVNGAFSIPVYNESIKLFFNDMTNNEFFGTFYNGQATFISATSIEVGDNIRTISISTVLNYNGKSVANFDSNGGSPVASRTVATGDELGELPTTQKVGYTLDGWYDSQGTKASPNTVIENNITFKAKWSPINGNEPSINGKESSESDNKLSNNSYLKSLKKSTGKLNPKFNQSKKKYKLTISKKKKSVKIKPIKSDSKAKVQIKVGKGKYKNIKSVKIKLKKGKSKKVYIKVIAEDNTKKVYKVKVKRKK